MAEKAEKSRDREKAHDAKEAKDIKPASAPKGRPVVVPTGPILGTNGVEIRGIVRMAGRDLKGQWTVPRSLKTIRGIGINLGQLISDVALKQLKITPKAMIGELDEGQMKKLEEILAHPDKFGVPKFMLNRQREFITNETHHLISTDLGYAVKQDVDHEKESYTWRGYRHAYGQKVRGQHTRSTGRSGMTVGVIRKAIIAKAGGDAKAAGAGAQAAAQASDKSKAAGTAPAAAPKAAAPTAKPVEKK
jgi:small subunit ribosomal protein S13